MFESWKKKTAEQLREQEVALKKATTERDQAVWTVQQKINTLPEQVAADVQRGRITQRNELAGLAAQEEAIEAQSEAFETEHAIKRKATEAQIAELKKQLRD